MDTSHWIWLATAAYGIHALEEFILDWRDWARNVFGLPVEWSHFYVVNFLVIVLGIVGANVVTATPWLGLGFAGLMIINALFFHIAPMIWTRGRYSPGVATAVLFFCRWDCCASAPKTSVYHWLGRMFPGRFWWAHC